MRDVVVTKMATVAVIMRTVCRHLLERVENGSF